MTDDVTFTHGGEGLLNLIWDYEIVKKILFLFYFIYKMYGKNYVDIDTCFLIWMM